ncbi:hypothetical protein Q8F55_003815 [Vanrija albida]|uniref:Mid2 domain-containing protein n=1 Tax=Vanrija albida TaxID=181172 RepID=A0ABR3Q615_9TREE
MASPSSAPPVVEPSSSAPAPTSQPPPSSSQEPSTPPSSSAPPQSSAPPSESPSDTPTSQPPSSAGPSGGPSSEPPVSSGPSSAGPSGGPSSGSPSSAGPTGHPSSSSSTGGNAVTIFTTITTTDANGNLVVSTSGSVTTEGAKGGSKTNVGAIAGGVVGGVVGLILILGVVLFIFRKKRKSYRDDFDDMMFDPARPQNHAAIDLSDTAGAPTVDPYNYQPSSAGVASTSVETTQYGGPVSIPSGGPHSNAGFESRSHGTSSATSTAGYAGFGAGGGYGAQALNAFPQAVATGSGPEMSDKQREAYQESQRFRVQNVTSPTAGPSGPSAPPAPVTVHEDGGAFVDTDTAGATEIPPTYDSIRR